jgi:uncharacterized glyoxalase superfamily protein PhnB
MSETPTSTADPVHTWPCLSFRDADAMMAWLGAVGFSPGATYREESGAVAHAEWRWPEGGAIMFGSEGSGIIHNVGGSAIYLVTSDPDGAFDRAVAAGARVVRAMEDHDYGGRGGSVEDPEGNHWSFGSYQPS